MGRNVRARIGNSRGELTDAPQLAEFCVASGVVQGKGKLSHWAHNQRKSHILAKKIAIFR